MTQDRMVLVVGGFGPGRLETSYRSAFASVGCPTSCFDVEEHVGRYCRFGPAGRLLNQFFPVEAWSRKANRDLVVAAGQLRPAVLVVVGQQPLRAGTLAQIAASGTKLVLVWVDALLNLSSEIAATLPVYDLVLSYGKAWVEALSKLGAGRVRWLPLAADPTLHGPGAAGPDDDGAYGCDVCFVGNWRAEREAALRVVGSMEGVSLRIWGGRDWQRHTRDKAVIPRAWQGRPAIGADFCKAVARAKVSLNLIDATNYPSANMRFFEIPCAGGLQVCSACPEMEDEFRHGETVFYYRVPEELPGLIRTLLDDQQLRGRVACEARSKVLATHTYAHRAQEILVELGLAAGRAG